MKRFVLLAVVVLFLGDVRPSCVCSQAADWSTLPVPGMWEDLDKRFAKLDGFAWYRCRVKTPEAWKGTDLTLAVDRVVNAFEVFWDGEKVGAGGGFPPAFRDTSAEVHSFTIP